MRIPGHPTLIRQQRRHRLKQLATVGPFVAASLNTLAIRCGRPGCHCADGRGHPAFSLTLKRAGRTVSAYVPRAQLPEVRQWTQEYHVLKRLVHEITALSLALLKAEARRRRAQRQRRPR